MYLISLATYIFKMKESSIILNEFVVFLDKHNILLPAPLYQWKYTEIDENPDAKVNNMIFFYYFFNILIPNKKF